MRRTWRGTWIAGAALLTAFAAGSVFAENRPVISASRQGPSPDRLQVHVGEVVRRRAVEGARTRRAVGDSPANLPLNPADCTAANVVGEMAGNDWSWHVSERGLVKVYKVMGSVIMPTHWRGLPGPIHLANIQGWGRPRGPLRA